MNLQGVNEPVHVKICAYHIGVKRRLRRDCASTQSHQTLRCSHMYTQHMGRIKRIWYLSPMRAAKVQASLRIRAVSPEPPLLAHTSSVSRGTIRQKTRSLAPLNGWACAVKICQDGMLEDTNSLEAAHMELEEVSDLSHWMAAHAHLKKN